MDVLSWMTGFPRFAHAPHLLAGHAGGVILDALVGGGAQGIELGGGHAATPPMESDFSFVEYSL